MWLVHIMMALDCTVLYNSSVLVPVTGTPYDGSRLYMYCTNLQYLWLVHTMMGIDCIRLYSTVQFISMTSSCVFLHTLMGLDCTVLYNPAVPVTGTHYDGFRLYTTVQFISMTSSCVFLHNTLMGIDCTVLYNPAYLWLVHIMIGPESRLYSTVEPAVPVIGTHYNGSKLYSTVQPLTSKNFDWSIDCTIYMYCTTQQYLWLVHTMMGLNWITVQCWSWINGVQWIHLRNLEIFLK